MQVPPQISFRNVSASADIEALIQRQIEKLDRTENLMRCDVALEQTHRPHQSGNPFRARVEVSVPPGHVLVASKELSPDEARDPIGGVIRSAFAAIQRQVQELRERQRGEVKAREEPIALVEQIFPEEGYGFLRTVDGRQLYFHRNSVLHDDFERLSIGTEVRYASEMGDEGLQATSVQVRGKPGKRADA